MEFTAFGHYRVDVRIGEGGMGEVFRAFDTRLNRPVADQGDAPRRRWRTSSIERFLREARAASALNHPNIVIIHEVGETTRRGALHRPGVHRRADAADMLAPGEPPIPLATVVDIGSQVARALAAAHAAGLMHRDVKPENIMLRPDGFVKVLDFGLARATDASASSSDGQTTHLATAPGRADRHAVPTWRRNRPAAGSIGPAVDVFALGVVLYEMAAGRRPFNGATPFAVMASIISDQPVPLVARESGGPAALDDLRAADAGEGPRAPADGARGRAPALGLERRDRCWASWCPAAAAAAGDRRPRGRARPAAARVRRVKGGRGLIVGVSGEPGIGKTSLVEDFLAELAGRGERPTVARGRCSERLAGAEAYLPVLEAARQPAHRTDGPSLSSVIKTVAPTWYVQVATDRPRRRRSAELRERAPVGRRSG